jgi:hypothetical protein
METIRKIKGNLYLKGDYKLGGIESNHAHPCEFPTIFTAKGRAVKSGNWNSCTSINTPKSIVQFYNQEFGTKYDTNYQINLEGLTETEKYEFFGLVIAISQMAEAYTIVRFGNHGTHEGADITNMDCAIAIFLAIKPMISRANTLLGKLQIV